MKKLQSQSGFSLSEMLVVIAILMILAGVLVGFGRHLKRQARLCLCESTIGVLVAAIEQYHDWHGAFPDPAGSPNPQVSPIENLYRQLYSSGRSRTLCEQIDSSLCADTDGDGALEFLDAWGEPFDYRYEPGWTFPVIESGGPDRDPAQTADNISSR